MFLGTYYPTLISKGRIALPKRVREGLRGKKIVLTVGFDRCIFGFDEKDWARIIEPELSRPLFSDKEGRDLRRKMCAEAMIINLGAQGRFVIPERMLDFADIKREITLIGAGDHFEIWNKKLWENSSQKEK